MLGAKVEVTAVHPASNGSSLHKDKFELLDTGSGGECLLKYHSLTVPVLSSIILLEF